MSMFFLKSQLDWENGNSVIIYPCHPTIVLLHTVEHIKIYFVLPLFHAMEVNGVQRCLVPKVLQIIFFSVPHKVIQVRNNSLWCE